MSSDDNWSQPADEALSLSLVSPSATGLKTIGHSFNPKHTYQLFGEEQEIFGYRNLEIDIRYHASDMRPNVSIKYSKKFTAVGDTQAADLDGILREVLPDVAFQKKSDFETAIKSARKDWTPPGTLATSFTSHGNTFEIWKGNLADVAVKQLVTRIQTLVPFFIEGGTPIDVEDPDADRWTVFFLYQKQESASDDSGNPYIFAGYSTVYRFFHFRPLTPPQSPTESDIEKATLAQDFDLSELPCRSRISQFLIIPLFKSKGLGSKLYSHIFQEYINHPQTVEITVEDPNEAFDDLRDIADLHYLRTLPEFLALRINTDITIPEAGAAPNNIVDKDAAEAVRIKAKIAPRQFARVLEMHLLSTQPASLRESFAQLAEASTAESKASSSATAAGKPERATAAQLHEFRLWRLMLKKRVYKHNRDALGEFEIPERIVKLTDAVDNVKFDYERLLDRAERQLEEEKEAVGSASTSKANGSSAAVNGKRKAVDEAEGSATLSKKARFEDA
ncbi:acyl-CoA N-acyltransferase [Dichotomopilus funicola]|uniref:Histone acetyltransferase type B catalytic subunit n=1 Tax=Dichotomopilus funicola TaxID=1934379 RepID=A0AAN6UYZ5_9PEZI|nr:acyl-CoA N-acyltransferase [Dichotomopilus funicola]